MVDIKVFHNKDGKKQETNIENVIKYHVILDNEAEEKKPEDDFPDKGKIFMRTRFLALYEKVFEEFIPVLSNRQKRLQVIKKYYPNVSKKSAEQYANHYANHSGEYIMRKGLVKYE